jgi:hypothetical protein
MDFKNEIINYSLQLFENLSELFNIILSQNLLYGLNMWYILENKTQIAKKNYKNVNQQMAMNFGMTKFGP